MDGMKVHGNAKDGWIVEFHNGRAFHAVPLMAKTEDEAVKAALQSWKDKYRSDFLVSGARVPGPAVPVMTPKQPDTVKNPKSSDKTS